MSFQNARRKPREEDATPAPRTARRAKPRLSLKMQAIGFLSRREHSRQELRAKLLDSLRKRAREDAALTAASQKAARELADALTAHPSNGIDDAFAPASPALHALAHSPARGSDARAPAKRARPLGIAPLHESAPGPSPQRAALDTLGFADGAPLSISLRTRIAAAANVVDGVEARSATERVGRTTPCATAADVDTDRLDVDALAIDEPELASSATGATPPTLPETHDGDLEHADPEAAVDQLLDWLAANSYLSESRFVESRVNARSRKQGTLRIKLELSRHGLALEPDQAAALRETEFSRAQALWQRKFGELAPDARLRARQARFLAARGFAADIVRRVVGGEEDF